MIYPNAQSVLAGTLRPVATLRRSYCQEPRWECQDGVKIAPRGRRSHEAGGVFLARPGSHGHPQLPSGAGRSSIPVAGALGSTIGFGAGVLITIVAALLGARDGSAIGLVLLVASAVAAITTLAGALLAAAQCWAFWDGFLVNDLGRLTTDRGGWQGLVLLLLVAAVVQLSSVGIRRLATGRLTRSDSRRLPSAST